MNISIFGLGYVGAVSAGILAKEGHRVIGVDANPTKIEIISQGKSPIIEKDLDEIIDQTVNSGKLSATQDVAEAMTQTELSFICVGTPSQLNGSLDLSYVRRVCEQIGEQIKIKDAFHLVVVRSTMLPGSVRDVVIPTLEEWSGKQAGVDFGVCINPEFLRESTAVYDFYHPPKTVIGAMDEKSATMLASLYKDLDAPLIICDLDVAEMVKYTDNNWHALKVAFANEIGSICKQLGIDSHRVMDIFVQDTKLNISPYYMRPGFAFGGSCLPKDVRALTYKSKMLDLSLPVLDNLLRSNRQHIERSLELIRQKGKRRIGVLGFSFKAGTDDLRESPVVEVIERLIGQGYDLRLYDHNVNMATLVGANRDYILNKIPHISKLMMSTMDGVLEHAELIIIGNNSKEFKSVLNKLAEGQSIIDLVRISEDDVSTNGYEGICW